MVEHKQLIRIYTVRVALTDLHHPQWYHHKFIMGPVGMEAMVAGWVIVLSLRGVPVLVCCAGEDTGAKVHARRYRYEVGPKLQS